MSEPSSDTTRRGRALLLAALGLALLAFVVAWMVEPRPKVEVASRARTPAEPAPIPVAPVSTQRSLPIAAASPAKRTPAPLEYMSDGVPIMPAGPDQPHDVPMHPHPITSAHLRIFRENNLLYQLNEAMDGREVVRLRALLAVYRQEYPEDPHEMQEGYALIADCLDNPSAEVRARARRYFDEEIASTLRRFVLRHCLDGKP